MLVDGAFNSVKYKGDAGLQTSLGRLTNNRPVNSFCLLNQPLGDPLEYNDAQCEQHWKQDARRN